jgi:hypothetical protein
MCVPLARRWTAALGALSLIASLPAFAENSVTIPDLTLGEGETGRKVFVHCAHDATLWGFSLSIRYDTAALRITSATNTGTSAEGADFWADSSDVGEIALGAVLDLNTPLTKYLAPSADHTLLQITFDVLGKAGTQTEIEFVDHLGKLRPVTNVLTNDLGQTVDADFAGAVFTIVDGSQTLPPIANAGPDQTVAEVSRVTLDASRSEDGAGRPLTFTWTQSGGPPVEDVSGADTPAVSFTVPPVPADAEITFKVEVRADAGPSGAASDEASVLAIDLDSRKAAFSSIGPARLLDDGRRALLFQGEMGWPSPAEEAYWTGLRFMAGGAGDESRLLRNVVLHVDSNQNGILDPADERLGEAVAVPPRDGAVQFTFFELLQTGSARRFFLVADVVPGRGAAKAILPAALVGALLAGVRRRRSRGDRFWLRRPPSAIAVATLLALALALPTACSSGGGGGGGSGVTSREVRYDIAAPGDLGLQGAETGVALGADGIPVQGTPLEV